MLFAYIMIFLYCNFNTNFKKKKKKNNYRNHSISLILGVKKSSRKAVCLPSNDWQVLRLTKALQPVSR